MFKVLRPGRQAGDPGEHELEGREPNGHSHKDAPVGCALLAVTEDPELQALLKSLEKEGLEVVVAKSAEECQARLPMVRERCIAILDSALSPAQCFQVYKSLHDDPQVSTLVLVTRETLGRFPPFDPNRPMLDDYLPKPYRSEELIFRIKALFVRRGFDLEHTFAAAGVSGAAAFNGHEGKCKSVVVFGAKGGVGKTTIAINLAVGLSQFYNLRVLLFDADLWFGDVGVELNLSGKKSIYDVVAQGGEADFGVLRDILVSHHSGVRVLMAPPDPAVVEKIPQGLVAKLVETYRAMFDFIVTNTHTSLEETNLQLMDGADEILLVMAPEVSAIRNATRFLDVADVLGYKGKLKIVLNRANSGVQMEAVREALGMDIAATLVSSGKIMVDASNRGVPVLLKDPGGKEEITRNLIKLVELVAGSPVPAREFAGAARR